MRTLSSLMGSVMNVENGERQTCHLPDMEIEPDGKLPARRSPSGMGLSADYKRP
jgi:hypothetical protein